MNTVLIEKHSPSFNNGILGCDGFSDTDSIFCLAANGDNNFLNFENIRYCLLINQNRSMTED